MTFTVANMLDPVRTAREEGRMQGRQEMRDLLREQFTTFATSHPNPVVCDELWMFKEHIERAPLS
ncbi:MAG: hypothetical protein ABFD96_04480 [Armatimonadia bacterium]